VSDDFAAALLPIQLIAKGDAVTDQIIADQRAALASNTEE